MKSTISSAIIASMFTIVAGIGAYMFNFRHLSISSDTAVWGQLGDYLNMFVSAASLVLLSVLTYVIHEAEIHRDQLQAKEDIDRIDARDEDEKARNRPVLIFMVKKTPHAEFYWVIKNISNNVALNPTVAIDKGNGVWIRAVKIYSLGAGQELDLHWFRSAKAIRAVYYDVKENVLTSTIQNDNVKIEPGINGLASVSERDIARWENVSIED